MSRPFSILSSLILLLAVGAVVVYSQQSVKPSVMTHDLEGKEQCLTCHAAGTMEAVPDVPEDHAGRTIEGCLWCHGADAAMQTTTPTAMSHDLPGRDNCMMCHTGAMPGVVGVPADHEGRGNDTCSWCHGTANG